jgi:hypothetical protein
MQHAYQALLKAPPQTSLPDTKLPENISQQVIHPYLAGDFAEVGERAPDVLRNEVAGDACVEAVQHVLKRLVGPLQGIEVSGIRYNGTLQIQHSPRSQFEQFFSEQGNILLIFR